MRFGLKEHSKLPSMEEFEKLAASELQEESGAAPYSVTDATNVPDDGGVEQMAEAQAAVPEHVTEPTVSSDPHHDDSDEQGADQIAAATNCGGAGAARRLSAYHLP